MSGIFKSLFDLQLRSNNQPLEDYLTEIFAYCLNQEDDILNTFLKEFEILDKDIGDFSISTQHNLKALENHHTDSRPDMVLIADDTSVFFENKINAREGYNQLQRYAEQLDQLSSKNLILIYLTRDYDPKDASAILEGCKNHIKFIQLRWYQIFRFLERYRENSLVFELLKFMKQNKLAMNNQFSPIDILTMTSFSRVYKIMDETMFGETSALFKTINGNITQASTRLTQLETHDRYVYYASYNNKLIVLLGFWMNSENEKEYPELGIEIDLSPKSETNSAIKDAFKQISDIYPDWDLYHMNDPRKWATICRKISLQEFLSKEDHIGSIKTYFKEALEELEEIYTAYPLLRE